MALSFYEKLQFLVSFIPQFLKETFIQKTPPNIEVSRESLGALDRTLMYQTWPIVMSFHLSETLPAFILQWHLVKMKYV